MSQAAETYNLHFSLARNAEEINRTEHVRPGDLAIVKLELKLNGILNAYEWLLLEST